MVVVVREIRRQPFGRAGNFQQGVTPAFGGGSPVASQKLVESGIYLFEFRAAQARQFCDDLLRTHAPHRLPQRREEGKCRKQSQAFSGMGFASGQIPDGFCFPSGGGHGEMRLVWPRVGGYNAARSPKKR